VICNPLHLKAWL